MVKKEYVAKLNQWSGAGAGVFGSLEPEPFVKKQEPELEPLGKKVRGLSR